MNQWATLPKRGECKIIMSIFQRFNFHLFKFETTHRFSKIYIVFAKHLYNVLISSFYLQNSFHFFRFKNFQDSVLAFIHSNPRVFQVWTRFNIFIQFVTQRGLEWGMNHRLKKYGKE